MKIVQRCVWISLLVLGFKVPTKYTLSYTIIVLCSILLMLTGTIVGYLSQNEIMEQLEVLSLLLPQMNTLFASYTIFIRKQKILTILKRMKENQHSDYILHRTNILIGRKLIWYPAFMFTASIVNIVPPLLHSFHSTSSADKNLFLIPYWFSCNNQRDERQKILSIFCWSYQSRIQFVLSNITQCFLALLITSIWLARMTLHTVLIKELLEHVEIFHSMIMEFNTILSRKDHITTTGQKKNLQNTQQEELIYNKLVQIIKYQQFVKNLIHDIVNAWTSHNATYVTNFSAIFILLIFIIIRESNGASSLAFKAACVTLMTSIAFTLICMFGHVLSTLNEDIFDAWCTVPWYLQNMKTRKLYAIALTQNMTPVHMKVFGIYELNLSTIFKFLKIAYSMLNVLLLIPK